MGYIINTTLHGTQYVLHATSFVIIDHVSRCLSALELELFYTLVEVSRLVIVLQL